MKNIPKIDLAWEAVNALGGSAEQSNSYDQGQVDAIGKALAEIVRLREALQYARPLVEKWCHTQGNVKQFFNETLAPIDDALRPRER